ncbi:MULTISPECIES: ABC transporter permease [Niastella]|uniref:ABC transporter permease subunit n=1 Tax=Niastella soli TaxID=2821487 RepID=A0ABS3YR64_9BACT|nr:ABC transporter permease subunit [Niastella soli]MBO9200319.1 ABC transporter permease subunit [Niastella soli]
MWTLLQIELFKIFKRPRTYIAFVAIAAIVVLIQLALYLDGKTYVNFMLQSIERFNVEGKMLNGYFVCYFILQTLLIHVPLLIALVGGDMIAGEANMGTLRLLISKPINRSTLLISKFLASTIYTLLLLVWMAFLSLLISLMVFGAGDLMVFQSQVIIQIPGSDVFWRYIAAFGFAAIAMTTVAALSFFLSLFAENSIGPIVAAMSIVIVCTILTTMDLPLFLSMKPYLFTSHMLGWKGFFDIKASANGSAELGSIQNLPGILKSALILVVHIIFFVGATVFVFRKKDVLS